MLNHKDIKDNKQLQSFAEILCSCRDTLKAMKCEDELNGGRTLLQIVEKLPEDIKKRWLTVNYEIIKSGCLPKLDDVVCLVQSEATKRADPIFGNLLTPANRNSPTSSKSNAKSSFKKIGRHLLPCQLLMNPPHPTHQRQHQDLSVQSALTDTS